MNSDEGPDNIGPGSKTSFADKGRSLVHAFTTKCGRLWLLSYTIQRDDHREGLIGDYDYLFLFSIPLPWTQKQRRAAPFFTLNGKMPVFLALLLGFQHALAMLAGIITPPIILAGAANLSLAQQQYLVSTSLIVCGFLSTIQITRFHIHGTPYYIGTGLISVVGTSFATISVAAGAFAQMYETGFCPTAADGTKLPCPGVLYSAYPWLANDRLTRRRETRRIWSTIRYVRGLRPD